jgi:hypothetical protein
MATNKVGTKEQQLVIICDGTNSVVKIKSSQELEALIKLPINTVENETFDYHHFLSIMYTFFSLFKLAMQMNF